jgi:hypothetical protein
VIFQSFPEKGKKISDKTAEKQTANRKQKKEKTKPFCIKL